MQSTTQHTSGVIGVVGLARTLNPLIGNYEEHYINERFRFTVRLSNGRVEMSREIAQDYEADPNSITQDRAQGVADSYRDK